MAYGILPEPGKKVKDKVDGTEIEIGPCIDENCGHTLCACGRLMAKAICPYCKKEIGYENPYNDVTDEFKELPEEAIEHSTGKKIVYAHRNCYLHEVDRQLVAEGREPMYYK